MRLYVYVRLLVRTYAVVCLLLAVICVILALIAFLLGAGPLKYYETLLDSLIYQFGILAVMQASLGIVLLLISNALTRFIIRKIPDGEAGG